MISIPKGKKVIIQDMKGVKGNSRTYLSALNGVDLVLEEDITLSLNSTFSSVTNSSSKKGLKFLTQLTRDLTGFNVGTDFKELGYRMWEKTDPLQVSITIGLYMKTNARTDVFEPMKALLNLPLPTEASGNQGFGLIAPGPSILQALGKTSKGSQPLLNIEIGNIKIFPAVVTKAEPTINKETDQNDYNISVKVRLDIQTVYTATTNMIDSWKGDLVP